MADPMGSRVIGVWELYFTRPRLNSLDNLKVLHVISHVLFQGTALHLVLIIYVNTYKTSEDLILIRFAIHWLALLIVEQFQMMVLASRLVMGIWGVFFIIDNWIGQCIFEYGVFFPLSIVESMYTLISHFIFLF